MCYKMQKRNYRNYQPETQNFYGIYLSLNFKILNKLIRNRVQVKAFDPYVKDGIKLKSKLYEKN